MKICYGETPLERNLAITKACPYRETFTAPNIWSPKNLKLPSICMKRNLLAMERYLVSLQFRFSQVSLYYYYCYYHRYLRRSKCFRVNIYKKSIGVYKIIVHKVC